MAGFETMASKNHNGIRPCTSSDALSYLMFNHYTTQYCVCNINDICLKIGIKIHFSSVSLLDIVVGIKATEKRGTLFALLYFSYAVQLL